MILNRELHKDPDEVREFPVLKYPNKVVEAKTLSVNGK